MPIQALAVSKNRMLCMLCVVSALLQVTCKTTAERLIKGGMKGEVLSSRLHD